MNKERRRDKIQTKETKIELIPVLRECEVNLVWTLAVALLSCALESCQREGRRSSVEISRYKTNKKKSVLSSITHHTSLDKSCK
jgi:hypothetical protein